MQDKTGKFLAYIEIQKVSCAVANEMNVVLLSPTRVQHLLAPTQMTINKIIHAPLNIRSLTIACCIAISEGVSFIHAPSPPHACRHTNGYRFHLNWNGARTLRGASSSSNFHSDPFHYNKNNNRDNKSNNNKQTQKNRKHNMDAFYTKVDPTKHEYTTRDMITPHTKEARKRAHKAEENMPNAKTLGVFLKHHKQLLPILYAEHDDVWEHSITLEHVVPVAVLRNCVDPAALYDPMNIHLSSGEINFARGNFRFAFNMGKRKVVEYLQYANTYSCEFIPSKNQSPDEWRKTDLTMNFTKVAQDVLREYYGTPPKTIEEKEKESDPLHCVPVSTLTHIGHGNCVDYKHGLFYPRPKDNAIIARTILYMTRKWPIHLEDVTTASEADLHAMAAASPPTFFEKSRDIILKSVVSRLVKL